MAYSLTKSKYIRGLQCEKALYFDVHQSSLARYDAETIAKFRLGREFEANFKNSFRTDSQPSFASLPKSVRKRVVDVSADCGRRFDAYPQYTQEVLDKPGEVVIFEAGFLYNDVLVLADVLHRDSEGVYRIYEVKNSNEVKDVFKNDVAIQYYVISHCLAEVDSFNLVYNDGNDGFLLENLLGYASALSHDVEQRVARFKEVISGEEPLSPVDDHCLTPYLCPYHWHCLQQ